MFRRYPDATVLQTAMAAVVMAIAALPNQQAGDEPQSLLTREVLDWYRAVAGGPRLDAVETLILKAVIHPTAPGREPLPFEAVFVAPDRYQQVETLKIGTDHVKVTTTFDGRAGWVTGPLKVMRPGASDPQLRYAREEFLRLLAGIVPVRLLAAGWLGPTAQPELVKGGALAHCVSSTMEEVSTVCFAARSRLPVEVRFRSQINAGATVIFSVRLSDHRAVDGVVLPHRVQVVADDDGTIVRDLRVNAYSVNAKVSSERFIRSDNRRSDLPALWPDVFER